MPMWGGSKKGAAITRQDVVTKLVENGLTVKQVLLFWREYGTPPFGQEWDLGAYVAKQATGNWKRKIDRITQTRVVMEQIVLPETKASKCDYMHSPFMTGSGGPSTPSRLLSHWWGSSFYNDMLCIVEEATGHCGWKLEEIISYKSMAELEKELPETALEAAYWISIFAVNQHVSNPIGHTQCQADKLDDVIGAMTRLTVALDPKLDILGRCWCVYEIGKALQMNKEVRYYAAGAIEERLLSEPLVFKSVEDCEASVPSEKTMLVDRIRMTVGTQVFDDTVSESVQATLRTWALLEGIKVGNLEQIQRSLDRGAEADATLHTGESALLRAIFYNQPQAVKLLLDAKASINQVRKTDGATCLHISAQCGDFAAAKLLIDAGCNINQARAEDGATPLYVSACNGHVEIVKGLVDAKASVDQAKVPSGATPLYIASQNGHLHVVKLLIGAQANANQARTDRATPLFISAQAGRVEVAKMLLDARASVNDAMTHEGTSPLFISSQKGHAKVVKLLLEAGAAVNEAKASSGTTPLYICSQNGHSEVVRLLIDGRAGVNASASASGATPLYISAQNGHDQVVKLLLDAQAAINQARADEGVTPLFISSQKGHHGVVKLLLDAGSSINQAMSQDGATPLVISSQKGHREVVKLLIDAGAAKMDDGARPLEIALPSGQRKMVYNFWI